MSETSKIGCKKSNGGIVLEHIFVRRQGRDDVEPDLVDAFVRHEWIWCYGVVHAQYRHDIFAKDVLGVCSGGAARPTLLAQKSKG